MRHLMKTQCETTNGKNYKNQLISGDFVYSHNSTYP